MSYDQPPVSILSPQPDLYAMPPASRSTGKQVCFESFNSGTCRTLNCQYSHDPASLTEEWQRRQATLLKSPFKPKGGPGPSSMRTPLSSPQSSVRFPPNTSTPVASRFPSKSPSLSNVTQDEIPKSTPTITFGDFHEYHNYDDSHDVTPYDNPMTSK
jgi:hypothetical protein